MRAILTIFFVIVIAACSSGPPRLNDNQYTAYEHLEIFNEGEAVNKSYVVKKELSGVSCTNSSGSRTHGNEKGAMNILKRKAAYEYADAIINVSCGLTAFVNNCWVPTKCSGTAVVWNK